MSQWSSYARADTPADPADLAPSGLSAKAVSGDDGVIEGVALAWDAPAEDAASVTGYEILRAQGDGELATLVADTGSDDTTYTDDTATEAGESYAYRVKALRGQEASQPSNRAVAIIPKATPVEPEPPIADRQSATAIWSATLNPADFGVLGCTNDSPNSSDQCSNSSRLSEDQVQYDGTSYRVNTILLYTEGVVNETFLFDTDPDLPAEAVAALTLNIGSTSLLLSDATGTNFIVDFEWLNSGVSLTAGTDVTVSLTEGAVQADTTPPALESATVSVNGRAIGLLFDEVLDDSIFTFPISLVSVTADGSAVIVGEVAIRTDPSSLTHRLVEIGNSPPAITHGQVVTVSYSDPTTGDVIQDAAGNDVASFTTGSGDVPRRGQQRGRAPSATVVWTATLNPGDIGSIGCTDASPLLIMLHCSQLSRLSEDQIQYDGTTYLVTSILYNPSIEPIGSMLFETHPDLPAEAVADLTLNIGDTSLLLSEATGTNFTGIVQFEWLNSGVSMAVDTDITVSLTGGAGSTNEEENAAPVFTSAAAFSVEENQTAVGTVIATDADAGDTVTYAVTGGADQAHLQIGSTSGVLTFTTAPDHESPTDDGGNNVYQVTVTATGGTGARALTVTQDITVTVTDVDEPPSATVVWTATLNPADIGLLGCTDASPVLMHQCSQPSRLSEDQVQYDGTTYLVTSIGYFGSIEPIGSMVFDTNPDLPAEAVADLTLNIGDTSLLLSEATGTNFNVQFEWLNSGVSMAVDTDVTVSLTEGAGSTNEEENATPVFTSAAAFSVEENQTLVGTVMATDADAGDAVSYAVTGGADRAHFEIDASSGILAFATAPDHENPTDDGDNNVYQVTVTATGGTGARALTATQDITVTVTDVDEPPAAPAAPTVSPVTGSSDSLDVSWTAPDNTGKPDIESYDLQYRIGTSAWTDGPQDETGLSATITGLAAGTEYRVQVRATNDEGDSLWSASGTGTTNAQAEAPKVFAFNQFDGTYTIGTKLSVSVVFSATVTVSGTPQLALDIGGETLHADYESGAGTQSLLFSYTVAVGDEDTDGIRVPSDSLTLNGGAITAGGLAATLTHGLRYFPAVLVDGVRPTLVSAETSVDGNTVSLTFSESLSSANATKFEVSPDGDPSVSSATIDDTDGRVVTLTLGRALSHDDTLALEIASDTVQDAAGNYNDHLSGSITNNVPPPNAAPVFDSADNFGADEDQTAVGTVMATDADSGDTVSYAVTGGDDQTHFQIVAASGVLTFATALDHESPTDADTNNVYLVTVTATGGTGGRALTTEQAISVTVNDVDETPAVTDVVVTSTPTATADTYGRDETIEVTVTFDQAVTVTGTPRIQLRIGGGAQDNLKWANYAGGTGTTALRFTYVVQSGDMDDNGIYIEADELVLNNGTIQGVDDDVAAALTYTRPGTQSGHKVDGSLTTTDTTTAPGAPTGLTAPADGQTVIDLSWTAPTDTGGAAITGYRIEVLPGGGATWTDVVADTGSTGTTYSHPNRTPGATYQYRVSAINSAGTGPASGTASATTGAPPTGDFVSVCDRSPSMKFSLVYEVFGITLTTDLDEACKRVTRHHLANIYSLTVWGPSSLSTRDLDGLTGLRLMSLSRGSLDSLPKGIFGGLGKLEKLNILYTDLDELDPAIFGERADDLKSLALWGNDITSLPAGVFDGLTALENLSIIEQGIQTLPADLLDDNTKLKKLTMRIGSGWTQMESGFLSDLGELRELHLGGNGLTSLPDGVFDDNRKLKKVYLYDNALASLPDGVFDNNTALEKVYLADNELTSLPDGIFDNTAKLKTVDLRNNNLETLPGDLFPHGEPDKLYLSGNPGHPFTFD